MNSIIDAAFSRGRSVVLVFVMLVLMGTSAYVTIPKESEPDIAIPIVYVSVSYEGIAPEDAERLLARPLEKELQSIEGLKEIRSIGAEGYASVTLEFDAGFISINGNDELFFDNAVKLYKSEELRIKMGLGGNNLLRQQFDVSNIASTITQSLANI